ncbi:hypothetical protein JFU37_21445 [Pseudomonas sp. TH41]|uniref:hypothetical protein n=1 Tax=Pseudomonas sp. TH41 TaxID=2796405 RepID=UPI001912ED76|nr:hypothetical protein [Pseudomonas sp. TH41]MBK5355051.1 hypothetical protein [Pseudomonas sp. TH41]
MDEALKAFSNPSWWVLSVFIGLLLNIGAPFINKSIDAFWASHSKRKTDELALKKAATQRSIERLAKRETGLLEAKMDSLYWAIRIVLVLSLYLLLIQAAFSFPFVDFSAAPIAVLGFLSVTKLWKRWTRSRYIHQMLSKQLGLMDEGEEED